VIVEQGAPRQENMVRVQNNINFFVPGPTGDGDDAQKLREKAQRTVYEMAGHECDLLRQILAKDCRLESINVNVNAANQRQYNQQQPEGLNVNGSMSLQITLK
jgi:predicted dehydrogenase